MNEFNAILNPIAELLARKNMDYGNSYDLLRNEYGPVSYLIRIADKLNRVKQLTITDNQMVDNESIEDTLKDIIGYTALELRYRNRKYNHAPEVAD